MEKRALLAAVLSIGVLLLFNTVFAPPKAKRTPEQIPATEQAPESTVVPRQEVMPKPAEPVEKEPETVLPTPAEEEPAKTVVQNPPREIVVENGLYRVAFNTLGATITSWELLEYSDDGGENIRLYKPVAYALPPISILLSGPRTELPTKVVYETDRDSVDLKGGESDTITFTYSDGRGLYITKAYTFKSGSYAVGLLVSVKGALPYQLVMGNGFGLSDAAGETDRFSHAGPVLLEGTDLESFKLDDLEKGDKIYGPDIKWVAQESKYFATLLKPVSGTDKAKIFKRNDMMEIALNMSGETSELILYAGPKKYNILKESGLQDIVDFGFWSFIAHPLFWLLKALYNATGNYGIAIVLISILTRVPFIPLMSKQQASMKKMQAIAPKIQEIKQKYKNDAQRINAETMKLYKEGGVNPISGCLPMLLQIPVFFALYKVLLVTIELRQAPFFGWLTDLSAPDTLFGHFPSAIPLLGGSNPSALGIMPILMGATMMLQQKLTPNPSTDPNQQKMMKYLPLIFTFMFFNLSSGLVLYWTVGNIVGIIQQLVVNKRAKSSAS